MDPEQDPNPQPEPEPQPSPEPEPAPEPEPSPEPEPALEPQAVKDWRDREIERLRRINRELRAATPKQAATTTDTTTTTAAATPGLSEADVETRAQIRAEQLAAQREFDSRCQAAAEAGRASFGPQFDQSVNALRGLVDQNDSQQVNAYNSFLVAALETGEAAKLVHVLGQDLDEASRVLALPPTKMAVELAKMSIKEPQELTRAPRPIRPIASTARVNNAQINPDDPNRAGDLPIDVWMQRRTNQVLEKRKTSPGFQ